MYVGSGRTCSRGRTASRIRWHVPPTSCCPSSCPLPRGTAIASGGRGLGGCQAVAPVLPPPLLSVAGVGSPALESVAKSPDPVQDTAPTLTTSHPPSNPNLAFQRNLRWGKGGTFLSGIWALLWHINTLPSIPREGANGAEAFRGKIRWTPAIAIQV